MAGTFFVCFFGLKVTLEAFRLKPLKLAGFFLETLKKVALKKSSSISYQEGQMVFKIQMANRYSIGWESRIQVQRTYFSRCRFEIRAEITQQH